MNSMKNSMIIIVLVIVAVLGIGTYMLYQNSFSSGSTMQEETSMEPTGVMMRKDDSEMENDSTGKSQYIHYSKAALDSASSGRRVLFFYASWCPTCKPADTDFTKNIANLPDDVTVVRVNYNDPETDQEEKDLAKKYGITYQHTFVQIDAQGNEVAKWNGGQVDELLATIK